MKTPMNSHFKCPTVGYLTGVFLAFAVAMLVGCASQESTRKQAGHGTKNLFKAPTDRVFKAAILACGQFGLEIDRADTALGEIDAHTGANDETLGERVAVWVRAAPGDQTEVEVISRNRGPTVLFYKNWERPILNSIKAQMLAAAQ